LDKWIFDKSRPLTLQDQKNLIKGIAQGMHHLHQAQIIHGDLAARNILVSDFHLIKLLGF
jgi:serine/threonine protein kinase